MATNVKILTLSDGFGDSWACPPWYPNYLKWPAILGLMTCDTEIINLSRYGAGNEYIAAALRHNRNAADVFLIQWTTPTRLDLMLEHTTTAGKQWLDEIAKDPVYHDNFQILNHQRWWLSSASKLDWVQQYHDRAISRAQHQHRTKLWIEYAHHMLGSRSHGFLLTYESQYLQDVDVDTNIWIWHDPWKGMHDWRHQSRYQNLDLDLTQPIPLIHFDFIKCYIMPRFALPWRSDDELAMVEKMLLMQYNLCKDRKPT